MGSPMRPFLFRALGAPTTSSLCAPLAMPPCDRICHLVALVQESAYTRTRSPSVTCLNPPKHLEFPLMRIRSAVVGAVAAASMLGAACTNPDSTESTPAVD